MKTTTSSLFLLLIFSITQSSFLFGVANAAGNPVLDRDGDQVLAGVPYYIVSAMWGAGGGGLDIGRGSDRKCPEIVVQRPSDFDKGNPVVFTNADSSDDVVRESSDVRVKFVGPRDRLCLTSTVWKVADKEDSTGKKWVELGGSEGEPDCDTVKNWFQLEMVFPGTYKFKYCPSVCASSATSCHDIDREYSKSDGHIRLVVSGDSSWPWVLMKAEGGKTKIRQVVGA